MALSEGHWGGRGRHLYYFLTEKDDARTVFGVVSEFIDAALGQYRRLVNGQTSLMPGFIEVFPNDKPRCTMPALPMGRGSCLCTGLGSPRHCAPLESVHSIAFRTRMRPFIRATNKARRSPIALGDLRRQISLLQGQVSTSSGTVICAAATQDVIARIPKAHEPRCPVIDVGKDAKEDRCLRKMKTLAGGTVDDYLRNGIPGPGHLYRAITCLLRHFVCYGDSQDEAAEKVKAWLRERHNGKCRTYNKRPADAFREIDFWAKRTHGRQSGGDQDVAEMTVEQVEYVSGRLHAAQVKTWTRGCRWKTLMFACSFLAHIEKLAKHLSSEERRRLGVGKQDRRTAVVASSIIAEMPGGSLHSRVRLMASMKELGVVLMVEDYNRGKARVFQAHRDFPLRRGVGHPVMEAIARFLQYERGWSSYMSERNWKRLKRKCITEPREQS